MAEGYVNTRGRPIKFHEGWLKHKCRNSTWSPYWCVLRDNVLYLFTHKRIDEKTSQEKAHIGTLTINSDSKIEKKEGERCGYIFDLYSRSRVNTFSAEKFTERELWKACVEGIATGIVPDSIDLLPGQIQDIRALVKDYVNNKRKPCRPPPSIPPRSHQGPASLKNGFDSPDSSADGSFSDKPSNYLVQGTPETLQCNASAASSQTLMSALFYSDPTRQDVPSWFFSNCSRDQAEKILRLGAEFGNTLMRESTNQIGQFAISKKMELNRQQDFTHYKIEHLSLGYKIHVENPHQPMTTLSEVMDFFVNTSGSTTTMPMSCNNLTKLGIRDPVYNDYNTTIVKAHHDADSGEETVDAPPPLPLRRDTWMVQRTNIIHTHTTRAQSVLEFPSSVETAFREAKKDYEMPKELAPPPPPPPPPHTNRVGVLNVNPTQPAPAAHHQRFKTRSHSVPAIPQADVEALSSRRKPKLSLQVDEIPPPLPPNHPSLKKKPVSPVPELPPNHPPPLKESQSDSSVRLKRNPPKHSLSLGSADKRDQDTMSVPDEVAVEASRINKQRLSNSMGTSKTQVSRVSVPEPVSESGDGLSTKATSESFKKKLAGLIGGGGLFPVSKMSSSEDDDPYNRVADSPRDTEPDNNSHYQNSRVLKSMMK